MKYGGKYTRKSPLLQILALKKSKNLVKPMFWCIFAPKSRVFSSNSFVEHNDRCHHHIHCIGLHFGYCGYRWRHPASIAWPPAFLGFDANRLFCVSSFHQRNGTMADAGDDHRRRSPWLYCPYMDGKAGGGSRAAITGSTIGLILGLFFMPSGLLVGPLLGAFVGEMLSTREVGKAIRIALLSFLSFLLSTGFQLILCIAMASYTIAAICRWVW